MSIFKAFETDPALVERGFWADFGEDGGEWLLAFAGVSNKPYQILFEKKMRPYRVVSDDNAPMSDRARKVMQDVWAEIIVLDWKNVKGDDEQPIEFSKENVLMVWDRAPAMWQRIIRVATDHNNFLKSALDGARKN